MEKGSFHRGPWQQLTGNAIKRFIEGLLCDRYCFGNILYYLTNVHEK